MKNYFLLVAAGILTACATPPPAIDTTHTSISQDSRAQFLVLHYTEGDFARALMLLTIGPVSSHYLVNSDPPTVYRLVDESRRAWHAGESSWQGHTQLNASSIGIEIVNPGYRDTAEGRIWFDFPQPQIDAVLRLVRQIVRDHDIRPDRIVGHSDIAPQRKVDPGPRFPWKQFADAGLIRWPDASQVAERQAEYENALPGAEWFQGKLGQHGYEVPMTGEFDEQTTRVLAAFQMRYRNSRFDGIPDAETAAILDALTR